jgi:site-specific DNA-methyltransferase (adenine-specific)
MESFKNITLHNGDCMEVLKSLPDNAFDLAICDPPYGINMDCGAIGGGVLAKQAVYEKKQWDKTPPPIGIFSRIKTCFQEPNHLGSKSFYQSYAF